MEAKKTKKWKKSYTYVLVANAIYIVIFFLIMQLYS
ncbi:hypothetical protein FLA105534_04633 [Flavobacterium bizetiae]|jgi:hypothetical protein|uniref:Uncharacterized protein n=1 Tax=Flavobacterium bizetiae TaxID=2704140 RepID=A0A6J4GYZ2_9FLAO|nr:hypothetical protein FLA105534_04633 [Flavobacterium bizetiae]CAD5344850.1 hypothetical protein FLA105535_04862 [Flavobacterium bizetiae]CAD5350850.1 hypothetical protein FLA105534_04845 [Flavobacterium bizetiae]